LSRNFIKIYLRQCKMIVNTGINNIITFRQDFYTSTHYLNEINTKQSKNNFQFFKTTSTWHPSRRVYLEGGFGALVKRQPE
jgi:hypothetical protein